MDPNMLAKSNVLYGYHNFFSLHRYTTSSRNTHRIDKFNDFILCTAHINRFFLCTILINNHCICESNITGYIVKQFREKNIFGYNECQHKADIMIKIIVYLHRFSDTVGKHHELSQLFIILNTYNGNLKEQNWTFLNTMPETSVLNDKIHMHNCSSRDNTQQVLCTSYLL